MKVEKIKNYSKKEAWKEYVTQTTTESYVKDWKENSIDRNLRGKVTFKKRV